MRAIAITEFGGADRLRPTDLDDPLVGPDSVLIRVRAAGINPVDYKIRQGNLAGRIPHFFPLVPGWDAAGVVEQVGPAVTEFAPGDEVFAYCRKDFVRDGTYAELVAMRDYAVAPKPRELSFEEAGGVPLAGLTALQLLRDAMRITGGERVLIHAAAGGVGGFAVQIAKDDDAHVIATASAANHDYLRELGADEVIDYTSEDFVSAVRERHPGGIDAVADLVGGEVQKRSAEVLAPGRGRLGSITLPPDAGRLRERGLRGHYIFVRPSASGLRVLAAMADAGRLRVHLHEVVPLAEAARAHETLEGGHVRGKIVLRP
ncbi:MAG TPA: NADP-dependent oxidoreductase [Solirubrobacteraceae bacterium]|nr:NADP-dependent oxidoreductase [Solirubrobacteraceae bacterium]